MLAPAQNLADLLDVQATGPLRVLDIAAGHGQFGIAIAKRNPQAEITAVDWAPVLEVARSNAKAAGLDGRYRPIAGNALTVDVGRDYDVVLLTNFLHHFDRQTCTTFLSKVHDALRAGGRVAALEFVPNDDRVTPPQTAPFSMTMLALTPAGDAYTFAEFQQMLTEAGFHDATIHDVPPMESAVIAVR